MKRRSDPQRGITSFLPRFRLAFPLPCGEEKTKEGNGKETPANGKDFGKEQPQTVKFVAKRREIGWSLDRKFTLGRFA
jgi:hypothetical protein